MSEAVQMIPRALLNCTKGDLESMGFTFGDDIDDLFVAASLPAGWSKRGTDFSMYSQLLDEKNRIRATLFCRTGDYDRRADLALIPRYQINGINCDPNDEYTPTGLDRRYRHRRAVVTDGGAIIYEIGMYSTADVLNVLPLTEMAARWLDANYPDWRDPVKYWD